MSRKATGDSARRDARSRKIGCGDVALVLALAAAAVVATVVVATALAAAGW